MAKRISQKNVGKDFTLRFNGSMGNPTYVESARLEAVTDNNRATFTQDWGRWEAYRRWDGRWAYGTSADILSVVA